MSNPTNSNQTTALERFSKELFLCLDETFEQVHGIYLDKGTSLFETLAEIPAEGASRRLSDNSATIAATVEHVRFYLDVLNNVIQGKDVGKVDWQQIWQTVDAVTPKEWEEQKRRLKVSYDKVLSTLTASHWDGKEDLSGALAVLVHTAYYLGGIRQAGARSSPVKYD